ncbi:unnamed protein product [Amoebophrya sp. A120]|nr:unnamed protein product [Amoebophrya sp. A120]|eukprot:GSA120T00017422001.1
MLRLLVGERADEEGQQSLLAAVLRSVRASLPYEVWVRALPRLWQCLLVPAEAGGNHTDRQREEARPVPLVPSTRALGGGALSRGLHQEFNAGKNVAFDDFAASFLKIFVEKKPSLQGSLPSACSSPGEASMMANLSPPQKRARFSEDAEMKTSTSSSGRRLSRTSSASSNRAPGRGRERKMANRPTADLHHKPDESQAQSDWEWLQKHCRQLLREPNLEGRLVNEPHEDKFVNTEGEKVVSLMNSYEEKEDRRWRSSNDFLLPQEALEAFLCDLLNLKCSWGLDPLRATDVQSLSAFVNVLVARSGISIVPGNSGSDERMNDLHHKAEKDHLEVGLHKSSEKVASMSFGAVDLQRWRRLVQHLHYPQHTETSCAAQEAALDYLAAILRKTTEQAFVDAYGSLSAGAAAGGFQKAKAQCDRVTRQAQLQRTGNDVGLLTSSRKCGQPFLFELVPRSGLSQRRGSCNSATVAKGRESDPALGSEEILLGRSLAPSGGHVGPAGRSLYDHTRSFILATSTSTKHSGGDTRTKTATEQAKHGRENAENLLRSMDPDSGEAEEMEIEGGNNAQTEAESLEDDDQNSQKLELVSSVTQNVEWLWSVCKNIKKVVVEQDGRDRPVPGASKMDARVKEVAALLDSKKPMALQVPAQQLQRALSSEDAPDLPKQQRLCKAITKQASIPFGRAGFTFCALGDVGTTDVLPVPDINLSAVFPNESGRTSHGRGAETSVKRVANRKRLEAAVVRWFPEDGFGFLESEQLVEKWGQPVFFHEADMDEAAAAKVQVGSIVYYDEIHVAPPDEPGEEGIPKAIGVRVRIAQGGSLGTTAAAPSEPATASTGGTRRRNLKMPRRSSSGAARRSSEEAFSEDEEKEEEEDHPARECGRSPRGATAGTAADDQKTNRLKGICGGPPVLPVRQKRASEPAEPEPQIKLRKINPSVAGASSDRGDATGMRSNHAGGWNKNHERGVDNNNYQQSKGTTPYGTNTAGSRSGPPHFHPYSGNAAKSSKAAGSKGGAGNWTSRDYHNNDHALKGGKDKRNSGPPILPAPGQRNDVEDEYSRGEAGRPGPPIVPHRSWLPEMNRGNKGFPLHQSATKGKDKKGPAGMHHQHADSQADQQGPHSLTFSHLSQQETQSNLRPTTMRQLIVPPPPTAPAPVTFSALPRPPNLRPLPVPTAPAREVDDIDGEPYDVRRGGKEPRNDSRGTAELSAMPGPPSAFALKLKDASDISIAPSNPFVADELRGGGMLYNGSQSRGAAEIKSRMPAPPRGERNREPVRAVASEKGAGLPQQRTASEQKVKSAAQRAVVSKAVPATAPAPTAAARPAVVPKAEATAGTNKKEPVPAAASSPTTSSCKTLTFSNLPVTAPSDLCIKFFRKVGRVTDFRFFLLPSDPSKHIGRGLVTYSTPEQARQAMQKLAHGSISAGYPPLNLQYHTSGVK